MESDLILRAALMAAEGHAQQRRKGPGDVPYVNHVIEVAQMVAAAGGSPEEVAAALLHDLVEDAGVTRDEIGGAFGEEIAGIVAGLTDEPAWRDLPRAERKAAQAAALRGKSRAVRRVKVADQTANLRDIARWPEAWSRAEAEEYLRGAEAVVAACPGGIGDAGDGIRCGAGHGHAKDGRDAMIPGEVMTADGTITLNAGREAVVVMVANTGDRPVQVGSHYHFAETNPALDFDRAAALGMRLDIAAGTAVRFEPGQRREVRLIPIGGDRVIYGFNGRVMGAL